MKHRGYRQDTLQKATERAKATPRAETLIYNPKRQTQVPFVITHNPANPPQRSWLKEKHSALHRSNKMKKALPDTPVVGERNSRNIRSILMPTVLPPPTNTDVKPGITKCKKPASPVENTSRKHPTSPVPPHQKPSPSATPCHVTQKMSYTYCSVRSATRRNMLGKPEPPSRNDSPCTAPTSDKTQEPMSQNTSTPPTTASKTCEHFPLKKC